MCIDTFLNFFFLKYVQRILGVFIFDIVECWLFLLFFFFLINTVIIFSLFWLPDEALMVVHFMSKLRTEFGRFPCVIKWDLPEIDQRVFWIGGM